MIGLWIATAAALLASLAASPARTWAALRGAVGRMAKILSAFLTVMILVSLALALIPPAVTNRILGADSGALGVALAALIGSVTLMPGFVAFPLCGALRAQGIPYAVLAAFSTTLMMVGVLTYPLERRYFGRSVTILRNLISLVIALLTAAAMALVLGRGAS